MIYDKKTSIEVTRDGKKFTRILMNSMYGTFGTGYETSYRKFKIRNIINKI